MKRRKSYGMRWAIIDAEGRFLRAMMFNDTRKWAEFCYDKTAGERIARVEILAAPTTKRKGRK